MAATTGTLPLATNSAPASASTSQEPDTPNALTNCRRSARNISKPASYVIRTKPEKSPSPYASPLESLPPSPEGAQSGDSSMTLTPALTRKRKAPSLSSALSLPPGSDTLATKQNRTEKEPEETDERVFEGRQAFPLATGKSDSRHQSPNSARKNAPSQQWENNLAAEKTPESEHTPLPPPPKKNKGGRPRKRASKPAAKRGRPKKIRWSLSGSSSATPPPAPAPLVISVPPETYTLPPQLHRNALVPCLAALVKSAGEYYNNILDPTNPVSGYLPENPKAWQTFVATPYFHRLLEKLEAARVIGGDGGNAEPVDLIDVGKAVCKFLWGAILRMKNGVERVTIVEFLMRIGCEVGKEHLVEDEFVWRNPKGKEMEVVESDGGRE